MEVTQPQIAGPDQFSDGQYRILAIEAACASDAPTTLYSTGPGQTSKAIALRFGESFRLRVSYECLLDNVPEASCGVAVAFTRAETMEQAMYFNTNYPHSDEEFQQYASAEFRQFRGRTGVVEGYIERLQLAAGDYIISLGILPNTTAPHLFYELHLLQYKASVKSDNMPFPGFFYPRVKIRHRPIANRISVTKSMVEAGQRTLASYLPSGVHLDDDVVAELYASMMSAKEEHRKAV